MSIFGAALFIPVGVSLGALLIVALVQVLGWTLFSVSALSLLPPPLDTIVLNILGTFSTPSWLSLLDVCVVIVLIVFLLYWVTSAGTTLPATPGAAATGGIGENFGRGSLIGFNCGINLVLIITLIGVLPGGMVVALVLVTIEFLSCNITVSNNPIYQIVLSYTALTLPMCWLMNALGMLVATINAAALIAGAPLTVFAEWTRANYIMHGGIIHGIQRTAFNMCNFTVAHQDMRRSVPWVDPGTSFPPLFPQQTSRNVRGITVDGVVLHETAHCLNVAAFGSIYHLIGFADQWAAMPWSNGTALGADAHSELCAESALRQATRNWINMWAPVTAANNTIPVSNVAVTDAPGVVALPGALVSCERNRAVSLNGAVATDADSGPFPLGHLWEFFPGAPGPTNPLPPGIPTGSTATIVTPNAATLAFVPDIGGQYIIQHHVTDGADGAFSFIVMNVLQSIITPPAAPLAVGSAATFDSAASTFLPVPSATAPVFAWTILSAPNGSALGGTTGAGATFTFTPDVINATQPYTTQLVVTQAVSPAGGGPPVMLSDSTTLTI